MRTKLFFLCGFFVTGLAFAGVNLTPTVAQNGDRTYSYSYPITGMRDFIIFKSISGTETQLQRVQTGAPGFGAGAACTGEIVVAAGVTATVYSQYWSDNPPSNGNWIQSSVPEYTLGPAFRVGFYYVNNKPYSVQVAVVRDGVITGEVMTIPANTTFTGEIDGIGTYQTDYQLVVRVPDVAFSDGQWVVAEGATYTGSVATAVPGASVINIGSNPVPTPNVVPVPSATDFPSTVPAGTQGGGSVWTGGSGTGATDALTNTVFRQGIDKITSRQDKQIARDVEAKAEALEIKTALAADKAAWQANTAGVVQDLANAKQTATAAAVVTALGTTSVNAGATGGTGSTSWFDVPLPGGVIANWAPWANATISTGSAALKLFITACMVVGFAFWMTREVQKCMATLVLAPQSHGNTIAGSGGQISSLIAAGVITVIILTAPVALAGLADNDLGWKTTTSMFSGLVSAGGATGQAVVDLLYFYLPVATMLACMVQAFIVRTAGIVILTAACVAIRWIVPAIAIGLALSAGAPDAQADVHFVNQTADEWNAAPSGGSYTAIPAGTSVDLAAAPGSVFFIAKTGVPGASVVEALDECFVSVSSLGVSVAVPSSVWVMYFAIGFAGGCSMELFGLAFRLFMRLNDSTEAAP